MAYNAVLSAQALAALWLKVADAGDYSVLSVADLMAMDRLSRDVQSASRSEWLDASASLIDVAVPTDVVAEVG